MVENEGADSLQVRRITIFKLNSMWLSILCQLGQIWPYLLHIQSAMALCINRDLIYPQESTLEEESGEQHPSPGTTMPHPHGRHMFTWRVQIWGCLFTKIVKIVIILGCFLSLKWFMLKCTASHGTWATMSVCVSCLIFSCAQLCHTVPRKPCALLWFLLLNCILKYENYKGD